MEDGDRELGRLMFALRDRCKRSQADVAREMHIRPEKLRRFEYGTQMPTYSELQKFCEVLALSQSECTELFRSAYPETKGQGLDSLRAIARFTNQIWPLPADQSWPPSNHVRGLGASQDQVQRVYRLGSRIRIATELDRIGHLLLLDAGPEELIYCLCPSWFAPDTQLRFGRNYLPQEGSVFDAFLLTGKPGREQILAFITDEPLDLEWMPKDPKMPARVLNQIDIQTLLTQLYSVRRDRWQALSTYFDVIE